MVLPNPDKPELKIEDCKLNIYGCRCAPSFFIIDRSTQSLDPEVLEGRLSTGRIP
jgi:hypothetical protein